MHLYKHFFKLISRNRVGIIIYACITAAMVIMLMASVKSGNEAGVSVETKSYGISYVDNDNSEASRGLIEYLSLGNNVTDMAGKSETEISNLVFFDMTDFHMTIPENFGKDLEAGEAGNSITFETNSGTQGFTSYDIENRINGYLNAYRNYISMGLSGEEAADRAVETMASGAVMTVVAESMNENTQNIREVVLFNINQYYPYLMLGFMALGIGNTLIIISKKELEERNIVAPIPAHMTRLINMLGLVTSGIVVWGAFMAFNFIYGAGTDLITNNGWVIAVNSFLCMVTCCSITLLFTSLIKTGNTLSMVTNIVGLSMSFFCGVMVPMRFIGDKVLTFSKFLPFYWTILVNNMTDLPLSKGVYDQNLMLVSFGIEFLFAIAISAIALLSSSKCIIKA